MPMPGYHRAWFVLDAASQPGLTIQRGLASIPSPGEKAAWRSAAWTLP